MRARSRREVVLKERAVVKAVRREGRREFMMVDMVIVFFIGIEIRIGMWR